MNSTRALWSLAAAALIAVGSATTYAATREGKRAYARHRSALEAILDGQSAPG